MEHAVWDKLMRGLSTRNYGAVVKVGLSTRLRRGGEGFSRGLRSGEVGGERQVHRLQPGKVALANSQTVPELGSYEMFQRSGPMEHAVWDKLMRGLSTRNYGAVVKDFREAYGVEKSALSDKFIACSREKLP